MSSDATESNPFATRPASGGDASPRDEEANPFAEALASVSLEEVPRATPGAGDAEDASGGGASGGSGGRASPRGGSLADTLGRVVGWSSTTAASPPRKGPGKDDDGFAHQYPFEDGILGEGLATYGGSDRPASSVAERERELARREARVALAEETLRSRELGEDASARRKNWPAFYPLVHHDLNADIPSCNRAMLRAAYAAWLLTASGYALNFATITFAMFGGAGAGVGDWFMALLFFVLGVPISFLAWYRGLYFAAQRTDRFGFWATASYGRFFLNFFAHLLVCCWMLLGLPVVGSMCAGVFFTLRRFGSNGGGFVNFVGALGLANNLLWAATLATSSWVGSAALKRFRDGGGVRELRRGGETLASASRLA
jgi:hypothetical protein